MDSNKVQIEVGAKLNRSVGTAFDTTASKAQKARKAVSGGMAKDINAINQAKQAQQQFDRTLSTTNRALNKQSFSLSRTAQDVRGYLRDVGKASKANRVFSRSAQAVGRGLDNMGNRWTALGGGAVAVGTGHMLVGLEERLERLGIQARKPAEEIAKLKQQIYEVAEAPDIRIDPTQLLDAVDRIVEKTGNYELAQQNLANIGRAVSGAGASGNDIGSLVADYWQKFNIETPDEMFQQLDLMVKQGKEGAFTLQALATEGENVTAAYANTGRSGAEAIREMGALLQVAKQTKGTYSETVEAFQSSIEDMLSNVDKVEAIGVDIWDQDALDKGINKMRSVPTIIKEIITNTNGNPLELQKIFGEVGILPVARLAVEYQKSGNFDELDRYLQLTADGTELTQDSERAAKTAASGINALTTAWKKFADEELTGPIKSLTELIDGIESDTLNTGLKIGGGAAVALGTAVAGKKVFDVGRKAAGLFGRGKKPVNSNAKGNGFGGFGGAGVTPVFVTNMPGVGLGNSVGGASGKGKTLGNGAKSKTLGALLGMRPKPAPAKPPSFSRSLVNRSKNLANVASNNLMPITLALGALDIGTSLMSDDSAEQKTRDISGAVGGMGGALAGGAAGAAIGSVVPIVGTAIGGLIGSIVGSVVGDIGGSAIGEHLADWYLSDDEPQPQNEKVTESHFEQSKSEIISATQSHTAVTRELRTENNNQVTQLTQRDTALVKEQSESTESLTREVERHTTQSDPIALQVNTATQSPAVNHNNQQSNTAVHVTMTNHFSGARTGNEGKQAQQTINDMVNNLESGGYRVAQVKFEDE